MSAVSDPTGPSSVYTTTNITTHTLPTITTTITDDIFARAATNSTAKSAGQTSRISPKTISKPSRNQSSSPRPLYLIRFSQTHLSFRLAEIAALERLFNSSYSSFPSSSSSSSCKHQDSSGLVDILSRKTERYWRQRWRQSQQPRREEKRPEQQWKKKGPERDAEGQTEGEEEGEGEAVNAPVKHRGEDEDEDEGEDGGKSRLKDKKDKAKLKLKVEVVRYDDTSPFCLVRFRLHFAGIIPPPMTPNTTTTTTATTATATAMTTASTTATSVSGEVTVDEEHKTEAEVEGENEIQTEVENEINADDELMALVAREFIRRSVQARGIYEVWGLAGVDHIGDGNGDGDEIDKSSSVTSTPAVHQDSYAVPTDGASAIHDAEAILIPLPPPSPPQTIPSHRPADSSSFLSSTSKRIHPLYTTLHASTHRMSSHRWAQYRGHNATALKFKFDIDTFNHSRTPVEQRDIINSFAYLNFGGLVRMKDANEEWVVFEEWVGPCSLPVSVASAAAGSDGPSEMVGAVAAEDGRGRGRGGSRGQGEANAAVADSRGDIVFDNTRRELRRIYLGRSLEKRTLRPVIEKHDLKKRPYISTTSMDAELALMTANLALAGPGKIFLDPFCGTGGFLMAAAELGAWALGSDIDGRSFRGKRGKGVDGGVGRNVTKYALERGFGGCLTSDLVNTPFRIGRGGRWLDGIVCDPPYGVREGLKVLGVRNAPVVEGEEPRGPHLIDGVPAHTLPGYVAPKKPYSFDRMLDDVLDFAAKTLVDGGRLAFWMPSANENEHGEEFETIIPQHQALELKHVCLQRFNRWSRRLLVYERRKGEIEDLTVDAIDVGVSQLCGVSTTADDLNPFRKRYFQAFAVNGDSENAG